MGVEREGGEVERGRSTVWRVLAKQTEGRDMGLLSAEMYGKDERDGEQFSGSADMPEKEAVAAQQLSHTEQAIDFHRLEKDKQEVRKFYFS